MEEPTVTITEGETNPVETKNVSSKEETEPLDTKGKVSEDIDGTQESKQEETEAAGGSNMEIDEASGKNDNDRSTPGNSGDKNGAEKSGDVADEYKYTQRDEFTSELYKLVITNLPKKFGFVEFKKKLAKLEVTPVKLKVWNEMCFVTFRNDAEKEEAMKKINGINWRGKPLMAAPARPAADPLMRKRKQENKGGGNKKFKSENDGLTPQERLKNAVTPLWKMDYREQLQKKEETMRSFLKTYHRNLEKNCYDLKSWLRTQRQKLGSIPCELMEILASPVREGYRNKCEFTIGPGFDEPSVVGFRYGTYAEGDVCCGPPDNISFIPDVMQQTVKVFQAYLTESKYKAFNPETHQGHWRQLTVRTSRLDNIMIIANFHPQSLGKADLEAEKENLKTYFTEGNGKCCNVTSCYFRAHADKTNASSQPYEFIFGKETITESLLGMNFQISPSAFFQVNTQGAEVLYNTISEWCEPLADTTVLDICCGTGTIGLTVAKKAKKVVGIEMCPEAIKDAEINAELNGITNVQYHCAKAEDVIRDVTRVVRCTDVVAIVDPPRNGLHASVVVSLRNCRGIDRVIYVSCNVNGAMNNLIDLVRPKSKRLTGPRFLPVKAVPVDLFPQTNHCELVILFEREQTDPQPKSTEQQHTVTAPLEDNKTEPQDKNTEPQDIVTAQQDIAAESQDTKTEPQDSANEPQDSKMESQDTKIESQDTN